MIIISKVLGMIHLYSFDDGLKPIIIAGHSHTPYLGFTRYLSTIRRIFSWYDGEPWIKGTIAYKNMQFARRMHLLMRKKVCQLDNERIDAISKFANPWCPDRELLLQDFAAACRFEKSGQRPYITIKKSPYKPKGINNADLSISQACFIGMTLLRTRDIGLHDVTDEELDAFCHMWRCYGYFLGIKKEYNVCRDSLEEIKQRFRDLYQYWITPNFKDITPEWEHMTRCIIEPVSYRTFIYMPYKAILLLATDVLDINMPRLYASLSYTEWMAYKTYKFLIDYVLKLSNLRGILNKMLRYELAREFSPEQYAEFHEKSKQQLPDFSVVY